MTAMVDFGVLAGMGLLTAGAGLAGVLGAIGRAQEMHRATALRGGRGAGGLDVGLTLAGWLVTLFVLLVGALWLAAPLALLPALVLGWAARREPVARRLGRLDPSPLTELKFAALLALLSVAVALVHLWLTDPPAGARPGVAGLVAKAGLPYLGACGALIAASCSSGRAQDRRRQRRRAALVDVARKRALGVVRTESPGSIHAGGAASVEP